jgi:tRNA A58 N-methylase Trm61
MWAREYQVLKNRTHPLMYMAAHSGYLLTAIKI